MLRVSFLSTTEIKHYQICNFFILDLAFLALEEKQKQARVMEEVINDVTEERKVIHVEGYMEIKFCLQLHCKTIPPCRSETASSNGFGTYSLFFFVFFPIKIYLDCPLLTMYQNQYRLSAYFSHHVVLPFVFEYIHVPVIAPNQLRMLGISLWLT